MRLDELKSLLEVEDDRDVVAELTARDCLIAFDFEVSW